MINLVQFYIELRKTHLFSMVIKDSKALPTKEKINHLLMFTK